MGKKIAPIRDRKMLHRICGILEVNALNIGLEFGNSEEVSALFENACILEHSCLPNCFYTFDTKKHFKIRMRAGRHIKKGKMREPHRTSCIGIYTWTYAGGGQMSSIFGEIPSIL